MTNLAEIQEAIEKLAPEERAALREWLDESDPDTRKNDLSATLSLLESSATGVGRLVQRDHGVHDATKLTSVEQPGNLCQLRRARLNDEKRLFDPLVLGSFAVGGNGDHATARSAGASSASLNPISEVEAAIRDKSPFHFCAFNSTSEKLNYGGITGCM
jgi:hypothetical protein